MKVDNEVEKNGEGLNGACIVMQWAVVSVAEKGEEGEMLTNRISKTETIPPTQISQIGRSPFYRSSRGTSFEPSRPYGNSEQGLCSGKSSLESEKCRSWTSWRGRGEEMGTRSWNGRAGDNGFYITSVYRSNNMRDLRIWTLTKFPQISGSQNSLMLVHPWATKAVWWVA